MPTKQRFRIDLTLLRDDGTDIETHRYTGNRVPDEDYASIRARIIVDGQTYGSDMTFLPTVDETPISDPSPEAPPVPPPPPEDPDLDPLPTFTMEPKQDEITTSKHDIWISSLPVSAGVVVTFRVVHGCTFGDGSTSKTRVIQSDGLTARIAVLVTDAALGATVAAEAAGALDVFWQIAALAPPPIPTPPPTPTPTPGTNLTPASLLAFYGEIRAVADDAPAWPSHIDTKVEGSITSILATINAGKAHPVVGAAGGNNSHYGTLHVFVADAIRDGAAIDDTNPEIATVLDFVETVIAWQKDALWLDLAGNPLPGRTGQVARPLLLDPYKLTNAIDLYTVYKQYNGHPTRNQMAQDAKAVLHRNGVWYTTDGWSARSRLGSVTGPYTEARPIAIMLEVWSMLHDMGVPYAQEAGRFVSGALKEGSWLAEVEKGVEIVGLLLNDVIARFVGKIDSNGVAVAFGDVRCAASSWHYADPVARTGKVYVDPYVGCLFQDGMLAMELERVHEAYATPGAADHSEAIVRAVMKWYRPAARCFPYLTAFVGSPNGRNNDAPILNHYWIVACLKVAKRTGDPAIRQMALDLMAGTATINWNYNMKQSQQLAGRKILHAASLL